ncbi:MAG: hypothetical protein H6508_06675 [Calditrichaeota bacterium]|nr:hypothetical protein [Calditrichota bacterium]MCB9366842.1 hypothetical protein [Calditrichota bacterium]
MKRLTILAYALCALTLSASAQLVSNPHLPIAAAQGMGGAYTAVARGSDAVMWNPAGLGLSNGTGGRFAYHQPYSTSFLSHLSASGCTRLPRKAGSVGIAIQNLSTRLGGETLSNETEVAVAHGLLLQEDIHSSLSVGYALKLISWGLGESVEGPSGSYDLGSATVFGLDVGATAKLWDRFYLAGAFHNFNHPQVGEYLKRDLPRSMSAGVMYEPYYGVRTSFDIERRLEAGTVFKAGGDLQVVKPFHIRVGVMTNPNIFTAGFGLFYRDLVVDYALLYHPILAPSHTFSVGFDVAKSLGQIWKPES